MIENYFRFIYLLHSLWNLFWPRKCIAGDFHSENDIYIVQAYNEAKLEIDRAINATINHLFSPKQTDKSPAFLMKFFRYPDEVSRNIVKPADIYARTLANVRRHVASGLRLNLTNGRLFELATLQFIGYCKLFWSWNESPVTHARKVQVSEFRIKMSRLLLKRGKGCEKPSKLVNWKLSLPKVGYAISYALMRNKLQNVSFEGVVFKISISQNYVSFKTWLCDFICTEAY